MPSVSVIVPVFRVEKYIERCLRCLFEQTLDDIEYIFIDDCTPDKSMEILGSVLSEYPERKGSVRIFRMPENSGQSKVREQGVKLATGKYIIHCDSDDCLDLDYYETLYRYAVKYDLDIVAGSSYDERGELSSINPFKRKSKGKPSSDCTFEMFSSKDCDFVSKALLLKFPVSMWSLMVNRRLYEREGFKFPPAAMGEDVALSLEFYYFSTSFGFVSGPKYYYMFNPDGTSQCQSKVNFVRRFEQACTNTVFMEEFLKERHCDVKHLLELDYFKCRHRNYLLPLIDDPKYYDIWIGKFPEINSRILSSCYIPVNLKLKYLLARCGMFPIARKVLRRLQKVDK